MANDITKNPIYINVVGVVMTTPLRIKKIVLAPTATTSTATLKFWIEDDSHARAGSMIGATTTASGGNDLASTDNFDDAVATDAIKIYKSSTIYNVGTWEVATVTSNDSITVLPATLNNEASSVYSWNIYPSYPLAILSTATFPNAELDFGPDGLLVPNLMVTALTTGTLYIYL